LLVIDLEATPPTHDHRLNDLKVQIYADVADKAGIVELYGSPTSKASRPNPTLMKKAGIKDYEGFAKDILTTGHAKPISLEYSLTTFPEMKRQALKIAALGKNVYVKIPITNPVAKPSLPLIRELVAQQLS